MIVTIGRQHGSNVRDIARALAKEMGYACFDKEIVDTAAENSSFSKEILHSYDEKRVSPYIVPVPHYLGLNESFRLNMQVASAQFEAIRSLAEQGDCIFVGRCADYVLRKEPELLRVFIMADEDFRINTMMEKQGLNESEARRLIRQVDKDRASYYRYYTDQIWGERENFDLILNSAKIGVDGCVKLIESYIEAMKA